MQNNIVSLVGTGQMALEYVKVLKALNIEFNVIGNTLSGCKKFETLTGVQAMEGGYAQYLENLRTPLQSVIIAIEDLQLSDATVQFCKAGAEKILVEKPAGLSIEEIEYVIEASKNSRTNIYIGYNRRFYASVLGAKKFIDEDGGVLSFTFDFTEWAHIIEKANKHPELLKNWLIANSSHVIDLAFFLGGKPVELSTFKSGSLSWHPAGAVFVGAGTTTQGAMFSFHSNWISAGRWGVELMTPKRKLLLRPLEKLQIIPKGSVKIEDVDLDYSFDESFKPGIYRQVSSFLSDNPKLPSISDQRENFKIFYKILKQSC